LLSLPVFSRTSHGEAAGSSLPPNRRRRFATRRRGQEIRRRD